METRCSHLIKSHTQSSNTDNCQKQNLNDNDIPFPACKTARTSQLDPIKLNPSVELFLAWYIPSLRFQNIQHRQRLFLKNRVHCYPNKQHSLKYYFMWCPILVNQLQRLLDSKPLRWLSCQSAVVSRIWTKPI